jgi:pimeloyl-ACP methyl ester carboxylesterase
LSRGADEADRIAIGGIALELHRRGQGAPLLVLHGFEPIDPGSYFVGCLAREHEVLLPFHPGFGGSARPDDLDSVHDLVRLYLDVIDAIPARPLTLIGLSFGGWLAAEIATVCGKRVDKLVLVDPVGIKIGGRETADIFDIFNGSPVEALKRSWHDPRNARDFNDMSDEELVLHARNREALCLYAWHPYLHGPKLKRWLCRIAIPTLVLWGESDRIVDAAYGRAFSELVSGSRFQLIEKAGHHPHLESPGPCAQRILAFIDGSKG